MLGNRIFSFVKKMIPRVSTTELIALRSGTTSIDRDIFKGFVKYPSPEKSKQHLLYDPKFESSRVDELLEKYGDPGKLHFA